MIISLLTDGFELAGCYTSAAFNADQRVYAVSFLYFSAYGSNRTNSFAKGTAFAELWIDRDWSKRFTGFGGAILRIHMSFVFRSEIT